MKRFPAQSASTLAIAVVVLLAAVANWLALDAIGLPLSRDEFNLGAWEVRHFPNKWLYELGHAGDSADRASEDADVQRYLQLQQEVDSLSAKLSQESATNASPEEQKATLQQLQDVRGQRSDIQNRVQAILEGRISSVASGLGLETTLPLFSRVHWLFPPVDFEFEDPPYVLVISPRDRIVEEKATLLRSDLTLEEAQRLESNAEAKSDDLPAGGHSVSALVVPTGGIGAYPAIIEPSDNYLDTLQVASHEWLHGYLYFHPLGVHYFDNDTLRTINETVADIAGQEMGSLVEAAYPLEAPTPSPAPSPTSQPAQDNVNVDQVLRQLRLAVDSLLAQGKVTDAEKLMEQTRQFLAEHGHYYRKINQAFFAFYGLYGTTGASSSPIGPELEALRKKSASLGDFIRTVSRIKSGDDLSRLLAEAGATPTPP